MTTLVDGHILLRFTRLQEVSVSPPPAAPATQKQSLHESAEAVVRDLRSGRRPKSNRGDAVGDSSANAVLHLSKSSLNNSQADGSLVTTVPVQRRVSSSGHHRVKSASSR